MTAALEEVRTEDTALTDMRASLIAYFQSVNGLDPEAMLRRFDCYGQQMYNFGYAIGRYMQEVEEGQLTLF